MFIKDIEKDSILPSSTHLIFCTNMSIIGPNAISVHTKVRLPARFATDNGVGKEITVQTGNPGPRQTVRIVTLLCLLFND